MIRKFVALLALFVLLAGCGPQIQQAMVTVIVISDGKSQDIVLPEGSTVQQALSFSGITLSQTDRVEPPTYTILTPGQNITVTRVREEFETQQVVIPFDRQELRNESLQTGETRLIQAGQNGFKEVTTRKVFENGVEAGSSVVSENVLQDPVPEIIMIGVQSPFAPLSIPGKLVYLTGGNAMIMEGSSSSRRPLMATGDLDGYIFSLSGDGKWLLFTRKSDQPVDKEINTLWAVDTTAQNPIPVNLGISNVIHFAAWQPKETYVIGYSTVEPRSTAPGWQANNDLHFLSFEDGIPGKVTDLMETNSGGIYGWWGMTFAWSPDGQNLAYSRPDGIGLVDIKEGGLTSLFQITPLNTHSDWAWVPTLTWGNDNQSIYIVDHAAPTGLVSPEESPNFDLVLTSLKGSPDVTLITQTGMFAYPAISPIRNDETSSTDFMAFWQAIFPTQSKTGRYKLMVTNSDGTNAHSIFPAEGQPGILPRIAPVWAPGLSAAGGEMIALIYDGNLWVVDTASTQSQQVTGDGSTSQIDWK